MATETKFAGRVSSKSGRPLDTYIGESREECARVLFARNPKAKVVGTSKAFISPISKEWADAHSDIQWIDRREIATA